MNKLTLKEAENIVRIFLKEITCEIPLDINKKETIDFFEGYIFTYNSKLAVQDEYSDYRISGVYPLVVDKITGDIFEIDSIMDYDEIIEKFRMDKGYS